MKLITAMEFAKNNYLENKWPYTRDAIVVLYKKYHTTKFAGCFFPKGYSLMVYEKEFWICYENFCQTYGQKEESPFPEPGYKKRLVPMRMFLSENNRDQRQPRTREQIMELYKGGDMRFRDCFILDRNNFYIDEYRFWKQYFIDPLKPHSTKKNTYEDRSWMRWS